MAINVGPRITQEREKTRKDKEGLVKTTIQRESTVVDITARRKLDRVRG